MNKNIIILVLSSLTVSVITQGQEIFSWSRENNYCNPSIVGLPRPKAFIFKYEIQPSFEITSNGKDGTFGKSEAEISRKRRLDFRLRFPIVNKPSLTIAAGLKYTRDEYRFDDYPNTSYQFYNNLEDRDLKSIGAHLYLVKPTKSNVYFILRTSLDFNGDYPSKKLSAREFIKFAVIPLMGWKKNENLSYGLGFSYGYTFGVPRIYPVFSYNRNFNCNWGIESLLPVSLKLRYTQNQNTYVYAGFELQGNAYRLDDSAAIFSAYNNLHIFQSDIRFVVTYEREIHDWLWFGIEAGARHNLTFNVTNGPKASSDVLIKNKLSNAALVNASIFIVPPKGFLKK